MIATVTASDLGLRDAIVRELDWDSLFDAAAIGVAVRDSAVTLTGSIDSYAAKLAAERAVKRVAGVRAVANDIQVTLRHERGDADIVGDVARSLALRPTLPEGVQAVVHSGHVTLTGNVKTLFQRAIAERAVHQVRGVKGVANRIVVASAACASDLQQRITDALRRDSDIASEGITVIVADGTVALRGRVPSWRQREAAERAAMHAPGVTAVENQLVVSP
ncbi:MAG: BON domain-containing protein [Acidobacteria bacterium]|nr:BON domain-containing protein [Acidobacteriota bacterium]